MRMHQIHKAVVAVLSGSFMLHGADITSIMTQYQLSAAQKTAAVELMKEWRAPYGLPMSIYESVQGGYSCKQCEDIAKGIVFYSYSNMSRLEILRAVISRQEERYARIDFTEGYLTHAIAAGSSPVFGNALGRVIVVAFISFDCSYCGLVSKVMKDIAVRYKNDVGVIVKHFPSSRADVNTKAALAAHKFGKYSEMAEQLYASGSGVKDVSGIAKNINLDPEQLKREMESSNVMACIAADMDDAIRVNAGGVPAVFVNGKRVRGTVGSMSEHVMRLVEGRK